VVTKSSFLFFSFSLFCASSHVMAVEFSCTGDERFITKDLGMLKSEMLPFNISKPVEDARERSALGDYRILGYGEYQGYTYPGLNSDNSQIACSTGLKRIPGISDAYESTDHLDLASDFKIYINKYNAEMLSIVEKKLQK